MSGNRKNITAVFLTLLMLGMLLSAALPPASAAASEKSGDYLVLVEEKDGTWSSCDDYVELVSTDRLMVRASDIADAIGMKYKKAGTKGFTVSNGKKSNTYTLDSVKYKYLNNGKASTKTAAYKPFLSKVYKTNMVEYSTLKTLVNVKYYSAADAGDYHVRLKYQGVICFSKYNKITKLPPAEEGIRVTTEEEFKKAVADLKVSIINIAANITLTEDLNSDREENEAVINIKKGKTLTVNKSFFAVGGSIVNDGEIIVNGSFARGICNMVNNGSLVINKGGTVTAGMSDLSNHGTISVKEGAKLFVERGSQLYNYGGLNNDGLLNIDNGGSVHDNGGSIANNGTIDLYAYFDGDISLITGSGKLNDYREAEAGEAE